MQWVDEDFFLSLSCVLLGLYSSLSSSRNLVPQCWGWSLHSLAQMTPSGSNRASRARWTADMSCTSPTRRPSAPWRPNQWASFMLHISTYIQCCLHDPRSECRLNKLTCTFKTAKGSFAVLNENYQHMEEVGHRHPDMPEEETVVCNIRCAGAVIKSLASDVWIKWDLEKWNLVSPKSTCYLKRFNHSLAFTERTALTASVNTWNTCNIWHRW